MVIKKNKLISVHGGHSGEFCNHAKDSLEDIIKEYIRQGFDEVGITEHSAPMSNEYIYEDEISAGLTLQDLSKRFEDYFIKLNELKEKYKNKIKIHIGFEAQTHTNSNPYIKNLIQKFKPDYIVGSVHHTNDIGIDYSKEKYEKAMKRAGSLEKIYENYFDLQYDMIESLKPKIIGHFDLVRIFDENYEKQLSKKNIQEKILRNLELIKKHNLIIELNMRALLRGLKEPYPSKIIRDKIQKLEIPMLPADDSHGIESVGYKIKDGLELLSKEKIKTPRFY